jgi:aqualysin 1
MKKSSKLRKMTQKSKPTSENKQMTKMKAVAVLILCLVAGLFFLRSERAQNWLYLPFDGMQSEASSKFKKANPNKVIPNNYIVVLKNSTSDVEAKADELSNKHKGKKKLTYSSAIKGFSVEMSEQDALSLSEEPDVQFVEEDSVVGIAATQTNATLGLDRIDQRPPQLDTTYSYTATGQGVDAYIIDSGIRMSHQDFGGRARFGADFVGDGQNGNDCHGHGTHIAGTIGSNTYGVAKGTTLYSVRVLSCTAAGAVSVTIAGINWVTANHTAPSVANLSIGLSGPSSSLDTAITNSIASGVTYAVAAGNSNVDACYVSPSRTPAAITVGSMVPNGDTDYRMGYSNWGPCVDIHAPGNGIISLSHVDDVSTRMMNGTSMAAPHVAGVAALYLETHRTASASEVRNSIVNSATEGTMVPPPPSAPNLVLHSALTAAPSDPTPPPPPPPSTTSCSGTIYTGSVAAGSTVYQTSNGFSGRVGTYSGVLTLLNSTGRAKLSLERKQGRNWNQVAVTSGTALVESINYAGGKGTYRWKVAATAETNYQLCSRIP